MKNMTNFIVTLVVLALFLALGIYLGLQSAPDLYAACTLSFDQVIESAQGDVYNFDGETEYEEPNFYYLVSYVVNGDAITSPMFEEIPVSLKVEQADTALQRTAWALFADLIPAENRQMVTQFNVFTDGYSNTLAAVDQSYEDPSKWILEVDIADLDEKDALVFTLIHEYAHLLTLNETQSVPDPALLLNPYSLELQAEKAAACPNYFNGLGCSRPNSYIQDFYTRFWADINDEWTQVDLLQYEEGDLIPYYNALYDFYIKHQDQFVDDYAVTHPAEDIAESFAYFIFSPKPAGKTIRDQKILFFYDYPELIHIREHVLNATCTLDN